MREGIRKNLFLGHRHHHHYDDDDDKKKRMDGERATQYSGSTFLVIVIIIIIITIAIILIIIIIIMTMMTILRGGKMGRELLSILVEAKFPAPFLLSDLLPLLILCSTFPPIGTICTFSFYWNF